MTKSVWMSGFRFMYTIIRANYNASAIFYFLRFQWLKNTRPTSQDIIGKKLTQPMEFDEMELEEWIRNSEKKYDNEYCAIIIIIIIIYAFFFSFKENELLQGSFCLCF